MTPSKQIPLTGILLPASEPLQKFAPPSTFWSTHSPSITGLNDSEQYRAKRLKAVSIIVSGRQTRLCLPAVSTQVQGPNSIFVTLSSFVAHECNRIGEFLSWVTNVLSRTTK